ncbi:MAG: hypothetical protein HY691_15190 [Chloroflexi bacterium]|nr:hypothetical protein [Chloroflexota bacterium]
MGSEARWERLARLISLLSYPAIAGPIGLAYMGLLLRTAPTDIAKWLGLCIGSMAVPLVLVVVRRVRSGHISDFDVSLRAQRKEIYLWGLALNLLTITLVYALDGPLFILAALLSGLVAGLLGILVNRYIKVSVHTGVSAMVATGLLLVSGPSAWPTLPMVGAVAWARYRVRRHTAAEIAGGLALGAVATTLTFKMVGLP